MLILKEDKVVCFDTLSQVLILKKLREDQQGRWTGPEEIKGTALRVRMRGLPRESRV